MSKRPNKASSSELQAQPSPHKRPKTGVDETAGTDASESPHGEGSVDTVEEDDLTILAYRDPDYYFDDGSVILRVGDVLFKIHASLIKARSTVFRDMFDMPPGDGGQHTEGTCDDHPVVIPGVDAFQFRNLMKMIYCPASDKLFEGLLSSDQNGEQAWNNFRFLLDIASLSHRFDMSDIGEWATSRMAGLLHTKTEVIADHLREFDFTCSYFLDALWHAKTVALIPRLVRDARCMIQYYCASPKYLASIDQLVSLFKTPNLRDKDAPLFGYMFLLLLDEGHQLWQRDVFTQMDRMALFSAQSYLTPLPDTLKEDVVSPLFVKPGSALDFSKRLSSELTKKSCVEKCYRAAFPAWQEGFDDDYYQDLTGQQALVPIHTLTSLPWRRLLFANKIRAHRCPHRCYFRILDCVDRDLEQLYTKLAGYYQEIQ